MDEMNEFLSSFGITQEPAGATPTEPTEPTPAEPTQTADPAPADPVTEPTPDEPDEPQVQEPTSKANKAFAEMRVENAKLKKQLEKVAGVLGIDGKEYDQIETTLSEKILAAQAQKQGLDPGILKQLEELESFKQQQQTQQTALAFQRVKDSYSLNDQELNNFANQLAEKGYNPFSTPGLDLQGLYVQMNFNTLMSKEIAKAVAAEQERAARAGGQGTDPITPVGGTNPTGQTQVRTVSELEKWFAENSK